MATPRNTQFNYLYRDASNYKNYGSIVLRGLVKEPGLIERLTKALDEGTYFVPERIGVPPIDFVTTGKFPPNNDDHPWHEFESWEPTAQKATDQRSPEQFVEQVEKTGVTLVEIEEAVEMMSRQGPNERN